MAIIISVCVALVVCIALFPKEIKSRDLSGVIFILGVALLGVLSLSTPAPAVTHLSAGPGMMPMAGAGMLFLVAGSTRSKFFSVINRIPASAYRSAYKAVAPAVIGLLATTALVMLVLL